MRLGRAHREAVDRDHVLRAGRKRDDAIHLGPQCHIASGRADRRPRFEPVAVKNRDVHEQIERRRRLGRRNPELPYRGGEIVGAIVVIALASEELVAPAVARREERVVDAA